MAESMATGWYYLQGGAAGQQVGPLTWEQLYGLRSSGSLQPGDLVWHPTMPQWMPAAQIQELFAAAAQPTPYQQAPYQPGPYQQATQPSWAGQGAYQPAAPRRSRMLPWLIPLIALIIVGGGVGAYFGFFYNKDDGAEGDASIKLETLYGTWEGEILYKSLDVAEDGISPQDAQLLEKVLDAPAPMTIVLSSDGDEDNTATMTMDFTVVDPALKKVTEDMTFSYSSGKLTFKSGASGDTVTAVVNELNGRLVLEGDMEFKTSTHSGEAIWNAAKNQ
jgi:hypothetical protein